MSQRRTKELLAELGRGTARQIAMFAVKKGDSDSVVSCYGYIHRDLQNLRKYGEAEMFGNKEWRLSASA